MIPVTPEKMDVGFVLICAALVFLMQAGFCMLESGMVRAKNSINVAVKNLLDFGISMLVFATFGFSLMFGVTNYGLYGSHFDFTSSNDLVGFFLFQMVFCGTAATIVSGAIAERTRLITYLAIVFVLSSVTYPLIGHWCWGGVLENTGGGWLANLGFVDWAGTAVVHLTGGFASLAAIIAIGPRRNYKRGKLTGGHSLTLAILGCFLLWFGWWGFNGGSGLSPQDNRALVLLNTNLGAVGGLLAAATWSWVRTQKTDVVDLISGTLAGLVSVTGACHAISPLAAVFAGAFGSILALWTINFIRKRGADDAVGAFGVHGAAGIWGTMVFAIFAPADMLPAGSRMMQLAIQATGALTACTFSFATIYGTLKILKCFTRLRVKAGEEKSGLNVVEHGATNEVTDLLEAMNGHRRSGDFSTHIETDTDTDVGQIASEYNAVIARVNEEVVGHESTNRVLQAEKLRLQSVLEHAGVGIYQLDEHGQFQSANPTLLQIFGYASASDLINRGESFSIPWHNSDEEYTATVCHQFQRGEVIKDLEIEFETQAGQRRWLLETIVPIRDENGCLVAWLGTVHDVTERKQAMLAEVQIAEAKSAAKGEFLANMSHEIRTPLNGVIGMLDLLSTSQFDRKEENYVNVARSSADTLLSLINDILDFSKIEAGKLELEQVNFDLRELMESTAEQFAIRAHSKGLEMNCRLGADLPYTVNGDPERLRQCIVNLMGNAIKFTESGEINLCVSQRGTVVHFSIQDTGIGISKDAQESLFESFVQADVSTTRRYGGSGLGLTIVNKLVQMMGGKLKVDSQPDEGSNFWFEIPLTIVKEEMPDEGKLSEVLAGLAQCNVLVVDDNATNCEILENQLACWGMSSTICQQPTAVTQKLLVAERLERPFDLIILDFCMPGLNGRDVAMRLKEQSSLCDIPIIMLSSNHDLMTRNELAEAGIDIAMTKPARQSRLFDSIVTVVYKRRIQLASIEPSIAESPAIDDSQPSLPDPQKIADTTDERVGLLTNHPNLKADVLIAEDNQVNQIVVQQMLMNLGYTSDVVSNGKLALEKIQAGDYRLILMDGHMPVMDGLTASRSIRQWESEQKRNDIECQVTPIVALTANVVAGFREQCIEAGMNDYMCKPITLQRLQETTLKYLGEPDKDLMDSVTAEKLDSPPQPPESDSFSELTVEPTAEADAPLPVELPVEQPETARLSSASKPIVADNDTYFDQAEMDKRCNGNSAIQNQLLGIMRDTLPERLVELREANRQNDIARVKTIAHQLKGAAGDTSLLAIHETAARLESFAGENQTDLIPDTLSELERRIEGTLCQLKDLLN